jgi:hypothetical protein
MPPHGRGRRPVRRNTALEAPVIRLIVAGITGLCLLSPASPAAAATDPWPEKNASPCARGEIVGGTVETSTVTLTGWIQPCDPVGPGVSFGIAEYSKTAFIVAYPPYDQSTAPNGRPVTTFSVRFRRHADDAAYCLSSWYDIRVSCVKTIPSMTGPVRSRKLIPISTDDPLVTVPVDRRWHADPGTR